MKHGMKTREALGKPKRRDFSFASFFNSWKSGTNAGMLVDGFIRNLGTHQSEALPIREFIPSNKVSRSSKSKEG